MNFTPAAAFRPLRASLLGGCRGNYPTRQPFLFPRIWVLGKLWLAVWANRLKVEGSLVDAPVPKVDQLPFIVERLRVRVRPGNKPVPIDPPPIPIPIPIPLGNESDMGKQEFKAAMDAQGWDQDDQDQLESMLREAVGLSSAYKAAVTHFAACLSRWNAAGMSARVGSLPAGFEIPNPTDLSGTGPIVKENLQNNIMAYVTTMQSIGTTAHFQNILPLVGSANVDPPS